MSNINILFIVNSLKRRGAEQQLFDFIKALPAHVEANIFNFSSTEEDIAASFALLNIDIFSGRHRGTFNLLKFRPLHDCLSRKRYDIIVTIGLGSALFFGRACALVHDKRIVYSTLNTFIDFHNIPKLPGRYFDPLNSALNRIIPLLPGKRRFRFLPNSGKLADHVAKTLHGYPIRPLYNGFNPGYFSTFDNHSGDAKTARIIKSLGECPVIAQVGSIDANKNHIFTIECLKQIREEVPNVRLLIIGDGEKRANLVDLVAANNLSDNVIFAGQMTRDDSLYLVSRSNLLVLTSLTESFPNVLIEALAVARPVVSLEVGAVPEIVDHGETGYIVGSGDRAGFIRSVAELLADQELASRMGKIGRQRVFERFSMERKAAAFIGMIESDMQELGKTT